MGNIKIRLGVFDTGLELEHASVVECSHKCLFIPVAHDGSLKDRIAVLRILERNALYGTLNLLHRLFSV